MTSSEKTLRADARRNRERIVESARELFARDGQDAQIEEIAAHAGVGIGTVYRNTSDSATVQDKAEFREWVESTGNWDVVDMRANKTVVRDMLNKGELVPGVKFTSTHTVGIRRT